MKYQKIPNDYKVGGQRMTIRHIERCNNNRCGDACLGEGIVNIADKFNPDQIQSESSKVNTFYHELVHTILDTMGETELSGNEKFVCCFSGFLTEAMEKAYFEVDDNDDKLTK